MSVISIRRDKTEVSVRIGGINDLVFPFTFNADSEWSAELLRRDLDHRVTEAVRNARTEAYNEGWKAAKSRKVPKRTYFSGWLS